MSAILPLTATFSYARVTTRDRSTILSLTGSIREGLRRTAAQVVAIGRDLARVKELLGYGLWDDWLTAELGWSYATARRYLLVWEQFGTSSNLEKVAPSALALLAEPATPEAARVEALRLADAGELVTVARAREMIRRTERAESVGVMTHHQEYKAQPCLLGRTCYAGCYRTLREAEAAVERCKEFAERLADAWGLMCHGQGQDRELAATLKRQGTVWAGMTEAERRLFAGLKPSPTPAAKTA